MKYSFGGIFIKKRLSLLLILFITPILITSCSPKKAGEDLVKIRLNEVVRSVFYAPMYLSINEGYFKEEGLNIDLSTGQGADKTMQQVLSGSVDIGFCGPEQVIYIYNQNRENYPIIFAQLTATDGSFLVGRNKVSDFSYSDLLGKNIIGGRPGGVPEMTLEYVLRNYGLKNGENVNIITNLAFTATAGAFKGGTGDYVALFEPTASMLEKDGSGFILSSIGKEAGSLPYTCFFSTKEYMEKNKEIIQKFTNAIYKGQLFFLSHSDKEVAEKISSFFPGTDLILIQNTIKNYRSVGAFSPNPTLKEEDLTLLYNIIQSYDSKLLTKRPPFKTIVNNSFALDSIAKIKK